MGGFIKIDAERVETTALNTKVNKEVFDKFKYYCKTLGYPMNVMLEGFMQQYANGRFKISPEDATKYNRDDAEKSTLNTTFNKEIYTAFKLICKADGYFITSLITAFMEKFANGNYVMEFVELDDDQLEE